VGIIGDAIATVVPAVGDPGPAYAGSISALLTEMKTRLTAKITGLALSLTLPGSNRALLQVDSAGALTFNSATNPLTSAPDFGSVTPKYTGRVRQIPATLHFAISGSPINRSEGGVGSVGSAASFQCGLGDWERGVTLNSVSVNLVVNVTGSVTLTLIRARGTARVTVGSFSGSVNAGNPVAQVVTFTSPEVVDAGDSFLIEVSLPTSTDRAMSFDVNHSQT
jgi:hypothetical protein